MVDDGQVGTPSVASSPSALAALAGMYLGLVGTDVQGATGLSQPTWGAQLSDGTGSFPKRRARRGGQSRNRARSTRRMNLVQRAAFQRPPV